MIVIQKCALSLGAVILVLAILWLDLSCQASDLKLNREEVSENFSIDFKQSATRALFGNLWQYDEYCGLKRSNEQILADDAEIHSLYNGTSFKSIGRDGWPRALTDLRHSIVVASKAKQTLPITCGAALWGYADSATESLANTDSISSNACGREIDLLLEFSLTFRANTLKSTRIGFDKHYTDFDFSLWLQLNTFARLPTGPPFKSNLWLGDYDGCLEAGERLSANELTNGTRYCYGSYGSGGSYIKDSAFRMGLCLPRSCSTKWLAQSREYMKKLDTLIKLNSQNGLSLLMTTEEAYKSDPAELEIEFVNTANLDQNRTMQAAANGAFELLSVYCPPVDDSHLRRFIPKPTSANYRTTIINSFLLIVLPLVWILSLLNSTLGGGSVSCRARTSHQSAGDDQMNDGVIIRVKNKRIGQAGEGTTTISGQDDDDDDDGRQKNDNKNIALPKQQLDLKHVRCKCSQKPQASLGRFVWRCFDARENLEDFLKTNDPVERLAGLNAIKVLAMNWLLFAHVYQLLMAYSQDLQAFRKRVSILGTFMMNGQHAVPVFFIISGLLFGHKFFAQDSCRSRRESILTAGGPDQIRRSSKINYLQMVIGRYLRLAPMYLLCYAYIKQFAHLIGSGPLWDYGVSEQSEARQCLNESWLVPIMMLANFIPPFIQCIITGWHIANDVQIILLLPIIFYAYRRSRSLGRMLAGIAIAFTHYTHVLQWGQAKNYDMNIASYDTIIFGGRIVVDRMSYDYVNPFGRLGTYLLGVLLADVLFINEARDMKTKKITGQEQVKRCRISLEKTVLGKWLESCLYKQTLAVAAAESTYEARKRSKRKYFKDSVLITLAFALLMQIVVPILVPDQLKAFVLQIEWSKYAIYPLVRVAVELGYAVLLYCLLRRIPAMNNSNQQAQVDYCAEDKAWKLFSCFLKLPIWNLLVKLNYCIMLTHFTIARWMVQSSRQLFQFNWMNFMQFMLLYLTLVYVINLMIHLFVEKPLNHMVKACESWLFSNDNNRGAEIRIEDCTTCVLKQKQLAANYS